MRRAIVLAGLLACGGAPIAPHHADLTKHLPATLDASRPKTGEPRQLHVRVWADAGVRATADWRDNITEQIDYASSLLTPLCGVRLVLDGIKDWDRTGEPRAALAALRTLDPGDDATWVIGYIAANDVASTAMSELGDAQLLGKHVIVRGWAAAAEEKVIAASLPKLTDLERAEVLAAHRRHKQTVVLLHQLAVTLGAIAVAEPAWIEHAAYSPKQSGFADRNRDLMQISLDDLAATGGAKTIAPKLFASIDGANWGGWIPADHDDTLATLRNVIDASKAGQTASDVPAQAYEVFDRVRELAKQGNYKEARIQLDNLLAAYPANATMHELRCELLLGKPGVKDAVTRTACAHVSELAPGDPSPHLAVGAALADTGDLTAAQVELVQAQNLIANLPTATAAIAWTKLIAIYVKLGALTWTEDALAAANLPDDPAAATVRQRRARYGVPRGAKFVTAADEPALVAAEQAATGLIETEKFGEAQRALDAAAKRWKNAPGVFAARCELAVRQTAIDAARAACARALAGDPDDSSALYFSGILALRDTSGGATQAGIAHLRKAITVDPELAPAWRALGKALVRAKDTAAFDKLRAEYQAKFNATLAQ